MSERSIAEILQSLDADEAEMRRQEDAVLSTDFRVTIPRVPVRQIVQRAAQAAARQGRQAQQQPQQPAAPRQRRPAPAPKPKFCTTCGAQLDPNNRFCTGCGAPI